MKVLLAGPGTGKTTKIKSIIESIGSGSHILIISFTNATVNDLLRSLIDVGVTQNNCMTLHRLAAKYNHDRARHVLLSGIETDELKQIAKSTKIDFQKLCDFLSCTTFDQMIYRFVSFAKANEEYLKEKLAGYDTLIVDEYQDFNPNEQALIDILVELIPNTYILGDDDQCIYDFKFASSERLIVLNSDPANEILEHEHKCYRCPDKVVEHATNLIGVNQKRAEKEWHKTGKIGELYYSQLSTFEDVAEYVLSHIQAITQASPNDSILILSPVGFAADEIVKRLLDLKINHVNYFAGRIHVELITQSWKPKVLFGDYRYLNLVLLSYLLLKDRKKLYTLLKKQFDQGQDFEELFDLISHKLPSDIKKEYESINEYLSPDEYQELRELYLKAPGGSENEKLEKLFVSLDCQEESKVGVMSIHKSKGLGADHVFMVGLTEGIIPNRKEGSDTIESQRRLFYVGMTRTKKSLHLLANIKVPGKYANLVNKSDFKYDYKAKLWNGRASTFIEDLRL